METSTATSNSLTAETFMNPQQMLEHWMGHRTLTRRVIEAFPEDAFFMFSIGGMRPFSAMVMELLAIAGPAMQGMVTDEWTELNESIDLGHSKAKALELFDKSTEEIKKCWVQLSEERFQEHVNCFGQYEGTVYSSIMYFIDNEIHHRAQGYVYLRALNIAPPNFWER